MTDTSRRPLWPLLSIPPPQAAAFKLPARFPARCGLLHLSIRTMAQKECHDLFPAERSGRSPGAGSIRGRSWHLHRRRTLSRTRTVAVFQPCPGDDKMSILCRLLNLPAKDRPLLARCLKDGAIASLIGCSSISASRLPNQPFFWGTRRIVVGSPKFRPQCVAVLCRSQAISRQKYRNVARAFS